VRSGAGERAHRGENAEAGEEAEEGVQKDTLALTRRILGTGTVGTEGDPVGCWVEEGLVILLFVDDVWIYPMSGLS
jgi:hypothetical protein